jgi:hypothetical protein
MQQSFWMKCQEKGEWLFVVVIVILVFFLSSFFFKDGLSACV